METKFLEKDKLRSLRDLSLRELIYPPQQTMAMLDI